jgi:hypothetical protein
MQNYDPYIPQLILNFMIFNQYHILLDHHLYDKKKYESNYDHSASCIDAIIQLEPPKPIVMNKINYFSSMAHPTKFIQIEL